MALLANTRKMTILAQDPAVRLTAAGARPFAQVEIPAEPLAAGPTGYRVKVVDYDAGSRLLYEDMIWSKEGSRPDDDPFALPPSDHPGRLAREEELLANPNFHSQNVYAIVMRVLSRFEHALGRRVGWSFGGHQLHVIPHAFVDANAFYSEEDRALMFGYFPGRSGAVVFTCLSHDVVAHEATHALLDGLRTRYTEASSPDQAALHEALADVVAYLSVFSLKEVVEAALLGLAEEPRHEGDFPLIHAEKVTKEAIADSILARLAEEFGTEMGREVRQVRGGALRRSVGLAPSASYLTDPDFAEEHRRGEILVAAFMRAFLEIWDSRILALGRFDGSFYNLNMVVEEGAKAADHLLTMAIRAIDYCPPTDIDFHAYLAALLTADMELVPSDPHRYRDTLRSTFASYGIVPPQLRCREEDGTWCPFSETVPITYGRSNFQSMLTDRDEVFRFIWENRAALGLDERVSIEVDSVVPSVRQGPDGFFVRETIVTYVQALDMFASEARSLLGFERPAGMKTTQRLQVFAGGALVFDQYGRIKYHIDHRLTDEARQKARLEYLSQIGALSPRRSRRANLSALHRARSED